MSQEVGIPWEYSLKFNQRQISFLIGCDTTCNSHIRQQFPADNFWGPYCVLLTIPLILSHQMCQDRKASTSQCVPQQQALCNFFYRFCHISSPDILRRTFAHVLYLEALPVIGPKSDPGRIWSQIRYNLGLPCVFQNRFPVLERKT